MKGWQMKWQVTLNVKHCFINHVVAFKCYKYFLDLILIYNKYFHMGNVRGNFASSANASNKMELTKINCDGCNSLFFYRVIAIQWKWHYFLNHISFLQVKSFYWCGDNQFTHTMIFIFMFLCHFISRALS